MTKTSLTTKKNTPTTPPTTHNTTPKGMEGSTKKIKGIACSVFKILGVLGICLGIGVAAGGVGAFISAFVFPLFPVTCAFYNMSFTGYRNAYMYSIIACSAIGAVAGFTTGMVGSACIIRRMHRK